MNEVGASSELGPVPPLVDPLVPPLLLPLEDDEIYELCHESRVPGQSISVAKIRDESEMKVPVGRVSGDTGNEPMLGK